MIQKTRGVKTPKVSRRFAAGCWLGRQALGTTDLWCSLHAVIDISTTKNSQQNIRISATWFWFRNILCSSLTSSSVYCVEKKSNVIKDELQRILAEVDYGPRQDKTRRDF